MGLFKVRPSRGSWAFFVIITVTTITRWRWGIHEQTVTRSDAPAAESARAFATCLFGSNITWVLRDDDPEARPAIAGAAIPPLTPEARKALWAQNINAWLRPHAASWLEQSWPLSRDAVERPDVTWPARCVAPLNELDQRRRSATEHSARLGGTIVAVRQMLQQTQTSNRSARVATLTELLKIVDDGSLAGQLALLFTDVRELSLGTRNRWEPTPLRAELYPAFADPEVPRWQSVHPGQEQVVLASPSVYFYRSSWDGRTHRVDFDRHPHLDNPVSDAVLWRETPRGGVLRASTEQGGAVVTTQHAVQMVALPDEPGVARHGPYFDWQAATNDRGMAWVTTTDGTVRLRSRRWTAATRWSDAVVLGVPQGYQGSVVSREPLDNTRWRVTAVRPPAVDVVMEQYVVTTADDAAPVVTPGARAVVEEFPLVRKTLTCGAEAVQYVALLADTTAAVVRVEGDRITVVPAVVSGERTIPWGDAPTLRCDVGRALLVTDPDQPVMDAPAWVVTFPVAGVPRVSPVGPLPYATGSLPRQLLLVDDGLVAVAAHASALRAWRRPLQSTDWEPVGFLAALTLSAQVTRAVRSLRAVSQGSSLAVWVEGDTVTRRTEAVPATESGGEATTRVTETRVPYRVLMMSNDSGRSFAGL